MTTQSETTATTRSIWKLDPNHTLVEFSGKHMMFTTVKGHFKQIDDKRFAVSGYALACLTYAAALNIMTSSLYKPKKSDFRCPVKKMV